MRIDQMPIKHISGPVTWRADSDVVVATVRDRSVVLERSWPIDARSERAALLRLAQDYPDIADEITAH